eukprot:9825647-Alexandrium_andersonii.AAC.1
MPTSSYTSTLRNLSVLESGLGGLTGAACSGPPAGQNPLPPAPSDCSGRAAGAAETSADADSRSCR